MSRTRIVLTALALLALVLVQVTLLAFLPTPVVVPDLVVVAVLAVAVASGPTHGPVPGGLVGVGAGMLLDLVPPAAGPLGAWTLVLGGAGLVVGRVAQAARPGPVAAMVLVALGAGAAVLARTAVLWFTGVPVGWSALAVAAASAGYALLLAPLALLAAAPRTPLRTAPVRTVPAALRDGPGALVADAPDAGGPA
jgi:hypothetical protein